MGGQGLKSRRLTCGWIQRRLRNGYVGCVFCHCLGLLGIDVKAIFYVMEVENTWSLPANGGERVRSTLRIENPRLFKDAKQRRRTIKRLIGVEKATF